MENKMNDKLDKVRDLLVDKIFKSRSNWSLEEMEENGFNNSGEMIDVLYKKSIKDLEEILRLSQNLERIKDLEEYWEKNNNGKIL